MNISSGPRDRYYRGYSWYNLTIGDRPRTFVDVVYPNTAGWRILYEYDSVVIPESRWRHAHSLRRRMNTSGLWMCKIYPYYAVWEIHEIEDEVAYQAALRAYLEAAL